MEYVCENENCERYGKADYYSSESFGFKTGVGLIGKHAPCPCCGKMRKEIENPDAEVPLSEKNIEFNFFNGMDMEQKKVALKQRSHEHYEKHIRERREGLLNQAKQEFKNMR